MKYFKIDNFAYASVNSVVTQLSSKVLMVQLIESQIDYANVDSSEKIVNMRILNYLVSITKFSFQPWYVYTHSIAVNED